MSIWMIMALLILAAVLILGGMLIARNNRKKADKLADIAGKGVDAAKREYDALKNKVG